MKGARILHILPSVHGYGAERLVVELVTQLNSNGVDAALLTIYETPPEVRRALRFTVLDAGRKSRKDRFFFWKLIREIRRYRPDIVHTHTHVGRYWGRFAALFAGARCIVHTEHNPCDFRRTWLERAADWILHRATSRVVTFFDEQGERLSEFERLPRRKLVVIPNGLALPPHDGGRAGARRRLGIAPDDFVIMTIGRMEYQKNHILALRAFSVLPAELRERALLLFAGSGKEEVMLRGLAHALKIHDRVRFLGFRRDCAELLPGADLVLMTSWFEGMPLTLLEAMDAGIPIVSTPWLGARDMLGDGRFGFLTGGFDPFKVAAEIERAVTRPDLRRRVAQRAQQHSRLTYRLSRMADAHRAMYAQLRKAS